MTFASFPFFLLLASTLVAYHALPGARVSVLLMASYIFYAWWNPWYALLLLASTGVDYVAARVMTVASPRRRTGALLVSLVVNLGMLATFKYGDFGLDLMHRVLGENGAWIPRGLDLLLPVGISFYTFQSMGYTIDVYRGRIAPEKNFPRFALFIAFFPQLVAGPIERARDLLPQLASLRRPEPALFESGVRLFLWGLVKKLVVADRLMLAVPPVFADPTNAPAADLFTAALLLFTMLYMDFSAYTDMARGAAALFGVRLSENFTAPLLATSIPEFWRRWHITLSTWVRDYLYLPLGGGNPRRMGRQALVTLLTMTLIGAWHGGHANFIAWGVQHGLFMVLYQVYFMTIRRRLRGTGLLEHPLWHAAGWTLTMILHALGMAWFFAPSASEAFTILTRYASPAAWMLPPTVNLTPHWAALVSVWLLHGLMATRYPLAAVDRASPWTRAFFLIALIAMIVLWAVPRSFTFVYFQF
jgi:D-alanyl-lipoteichoic acid acyltransferase DltB (MBOAT superfamily)